MFGAVLNRLATSVRRALSKYAVGTQEPELAFDFIDNEYITNNSTSNFASAITHSRSGNATMTDGYGPELVANGDFSSGDLTGWTDNSTGSGSVSVVNNTLLLAGTDTSNRGFVTSDSFTTKPNVAYVIELSVTDRQGSGDLQLQFSDVGGNRLDEFPITAKGRYQYTVIAQRTASYLKINCYDDDSVSIDNVSVREMPVIKWAPHNLVINSEDSDSATKTSVGVVSDAIAAPNGTITADKVTANSATSAHFLRRNASTTAGQEITLAVFAKAAEYDYIAVYAGTAGKGKYFDLNSGAILGNLISAPNDARITDVGDGWYLCEIDVTAATNDALSIYLSDTGSRFSFLGDGSSGVYLWGAHLYRSDLGGMVDNPDQPPSRASYVPTTSSAKYLPRIGHHVFNGSAWVNEGLLAESEARTNVLLKSGEFNTWPTRIKVTVTDDAVISPDGNESASTVVLTTVSGEHYVQYDLTADTGTFTDSAYVKADGYKRVFIRPVHVGATEGSTQNIEFDVEAGTVLNAPSGTTGTIQDVGNGWYRIAATYTVSGTITGAYGFRVQILDNTGVGSFAGDGTSGIQIYGAQREKASTPSSLIPTSGSSVTRPAETFTIPSANLPWPSPVYIGSELVTNGTFDTDSDWTKGTNATISGGTLSYAGGSGNGDTYQNVGLVVGKVYWGVFTVSNRTAGSVKLRQGGVSSGGTVGASADGTYSSAFVVPSGANANLLVDVSADFVGDIDNISVREINPLSVSIAMDGRITYADLNENVAGYFYQWREDSNNRVVQTLVTNSGTGAVSFQQVEGGIFDAKTTGGSLLSPDVLVPYNTAGRHGSTFVNGAVDGVALTADTTPTALADLSATDLNLVYDYMGTVGTFRVWDKDLGDTGLVEATNPSLEPSLSLTFEGTGTNSFVVNDWSE